MPIESAGEINEIKLNDVEKTKKTWLELINQSPKLLLTLKYS